ncbi:MAG TPA: hypothetical protein VNR60_01475 [Croceibacterium sp.]|nr:hypothetical protein [Croceibacterium sp.]
MSGAALARAAEGHLGTPFRLHGHDPLTGLDCVGLVAVALAEIGRPVVPPQRYGLRHRAAEHLLPLAAAAGLAEVTSPAEAGDVLLLQAGPAQLHLAVAACGGGIVHAHAGLRRVVITPFPLAWPVIRHWRLSDR